MLCDAPHNTWYVVRPSLWVWLMDGYYVIRRLSGKYRHENIIRQQLNWDIIITPKFIFNDTTRLEERKDFDDSPWSFRIRQMLSIRLPIQCWPHHNVVLFDEIFFNLNNPGWIDSRTLIDQNRFFIGIGTQLSRQVNFDIGYIKQYEWRIEHDQNSNILYFILNVFVD